MVCLLTSPGSLLANELVRFFGVEPWIYMVRFHDYSSLLTVSGLIRALWPVLPFLLVFEINRALLLGNFRVREYKVIFVTYLVNRMFLSILPVSAVAYCIGLLEPFALFKSSFTWYWLVYAYVVWELGHFVYHYLAHKVRLLWCLHSTHHAPECINLFVTDAHFFFEYPYADAVRTSVCVLLGVSPPVLVIVMLIDSFWAMYIHVGENLLDNGRLGLLNHFILTPSHHRVHHARNPLYIDKNFCNLLPIWDWLFGTLQSEMPGIRLEYGITRPINVGSFSDFYFGEFRALWRDVKGAPGIGAKLGYLVRPPGWSHVNAGKTLTRLHRIPLPRT